MQTNPVILLASERSGTNLLRAIVSSHPQVASPPPSGVVGLLAKRAYKYLPPLRRSHIQELIADAILATDTHLNKWNVELDAAEIRQRMEDESFWELFRAINDTYAEQHKCDYWFSKEPDLYEHIYEIALHMPTAKFVYLVRDGRDVAASMLKGKVHEHHVYYAARRWAENQRMCLTALSDSRLRNRILMLKYEDLISEPETQAVRLMDFLGLSFDPAQLEFYRNDAVVEHAKVSEFWKNLAKPIDANNAGNYRQYLSSNDIEIFESIASQEMRMLGYPMETKGERQFSFLDMSKFNFIAAWRRKRARLSNDEEMNRRKQRNALLRPVVERSFDA